MILEFLKEYWFLITFVGGQYDTSTLKWIYVQMGRLKEKLCKQILGYIF